jgi:uncharacterized protein YutE (UPF0331/DUF86 family)
MDEKELKVRIEEKIVELEKYLEEFNLIEIPEFEEYIKDIKIKAISERYFEKIMEVIINLTLLLIRYKKLKQPEDEDHAFSILSKNKIISEDLSKRLKDAKDMRNIIIHNYLKVEDIIVYQAVTEEIIRDSDEFLEKIKVAIS